MTASSFSQLRLLHPRVRELHKKEDSLCMAGARGHHIASVGSNWSMKKNCSVSLTDQEFLSLDSQSKLQSYISISMQTDPG